MNNADLQQIIIYIWPVALLQIGVQIYSIVDIARKKKTKNLSPTFWLIIVILGSLLGSIAYLIFGRNDD